MHNILGYNGMGCQISRDAKYTVTLVVQILMLYLSHSTDYLVFNVKESSPWRQVMHISRCPTPSRAIFLSSISTANVGNII